MISRSCLLLGKQLERSATVGLARGFADVKGEKTEFQRISTNVTFADRISNSKNLEEALTLAQNSAENQTVTGAINTLKGITRLHQYNINQEFQRLRNDTRFSSIIDRIKGNLDSLSDNDVQDLLYVLRRFTSFDCPTGFTSVEIEKLKQRIIKGMQSEEIPLKTLIHAYFNFCFIQYDTSMIANFLLKKVKENPGILNSFHYSYLIMAVSTKPNNCSSIDYLLAEESARAITNYIEEFDSSKKCDLFKHLAQIELHLNSPNMQVPALLYKLKNSIKDSLDKLSESDILAMLEAHRYLPPQVPNDLLTEFKSMVLVTMQHNSNNLKTSFLINFLKIQNRLSRNRRLSAEGIKKIVETLINRFSEDNQIRTNVLLIIKTLKMNKVTVDGLAKECSKYLEANPDSKRDKEIFMIEYLIDQGKPVHAFIEKVVKTRGDSDYSVNTFRRLAHALKFSQKPEYQKSIELLENHPKYNLDTNLTPAVLRGLFSDSDVINSTKVLERTIARVASNKEDLELGPIQIENLVQAATTYESVNGFIKNETYRGVLSSLTPQRLNTFLNKFSDIEHPNNPQFYFLLKVLQLNRSKLSIRKMTSFVTANIDELVNISRRNESLFLKFINFFCSLEEVNQANNLYQVFSIVYKLEEFGVKNELLNSLLLDTYINNRKEGKILRLNIEVEICKALISSDMLPVDIAVELHEKIKDKQRYTFNDSEKALLCHILRSKKIQGDQRKPYEEVAKARIAELVTKLVELDPKITLPAFKELIAFPPELLEEHRTKLKDAIKDGMASITTKTFCELVSAFPPQRLSKHYDFYHPIIRELFFELPITLKKLRTSQIVELLELAASANLRNTTVYNNILAEIGSNFNSLKNSEFISIISSFSSLGLKQPDLFDKIFTRILQDNSSLTGFERTKILSAFYAVGFDSTLLKSKLLQFIVLRNRISPILFATVVPYVLNLNLENEKKLLEDLFVLYSQNPVKRKLTMSAAALMTEAILQLKYPDSTFASQWATMFEGKREGPFEFQPANKTVLSYLDCMSVRYEVQKEIDGFQFALYLPDQNSIVLMLSREDSNFDKHSLKGRGMLNLRLTKEIAAKHQLKVVSVNIPEFNFNKDDMAKVLYLVAQGVTSLTAQDKYDFSKIVKKQDPREELETPKSLADELPVDVKELEMLSEDEEAPKRP